MIPQVKNITEARDYFLSHSSGAVLCCGADGIEWEAKTFPEAKAFFQEHGEQ